MAEIKTGLRVAVTGHRPQHLNAEDGFWIQDEFERLMVKLSPSVAISGMALGADTWWAETALNLRVPLHAYVPFLGQDSRWRASDREFYRDLLERATEVIIVCPEYGPGAFELRNRAMVDNCDLLVAAWNGKRSGGTFNAVRYAEKIGRRIVHVDPTRRLTTRKIKVEV
jgi:uncharacterized phage-like protein YoqJ